MSTVRRIAALFLVAIWLPAVLHCQIESLAGVNCCASERTDHGHKKSCAGDICDNLEAGFNKVSSEQITVAAPQICACLICCIPSPAVQTVSGPLVTGIIEEAAAPPEIIQSWHFLSRAALPARDPDCVS